MPPTAAELGLCGDSKARGDTWAAGTGNCAHPALGLQIRGASTALMAPSALQRREQLWELPQKLAEPH